MARLNRKGQSTLEYGIIIAVVVAVLLAMQMYIKQRLQGGFKKAADDMGESFSPLHTTASSSVTTAVTSTETVNGGANPITQRSSNQNQNSQSSENVGALTLETID